MQRRVKLALAAGGLVISSLAGAAGSPAGETAGPSVLKSGSIILYDQNGIVKRIDAHGNFARAVVKPGRNPGSKGGGWAEFSPNGRQVVYTDGDLYRIGTFNRKGTRPTRLTKTRVIERFPTWGANGGIVFQIYADGEDLANEPVLMAINENGRARRTIFNHKRMVEQQVGPVDSYTNFMGEPQFHPNGRRILFTMSGRWYQEPNEFTLIREEFGGIYTMNIDGSGLRQLTDTGNQPDGFHVDDRCAIWMPNGKIIYRHVGGPDTGGDPFEDVDEMRMINGDGSGMRRLSAIDGTAQEACPVPSPKGQRVVYSRELAPRGSTTQLFIRNIFDLKENRLTGGSGPKTPTDWALINPGR